ncbi:MAG: sugar phosphate isomerase/epimerase [Clostridia bacterium]|nr:sugar phosphate isomerase/epimerase [Clostridia bacterium]
MKFGVVSDLSNIDLIAELGFDYIEGHVTAIANLTDEEFAELEAKVAAAPIKVEACCVLLPGSIKVTGPDYDPAVQEAYLEKVFARLQKLNVGPVVFGSGSARKIPEGFDRAEAWHQLVTFGRLTARLAAKYGLTMVMEPLNTMETNIINTQIDGIKLMEDIDRPSFAILSDFYHLALAGEGRAEVAACGAHLKHTHIANPVGRVMPKEGDGIDYDAFFAGLADCGYRGRMSLEGKISDMRAELPVSLALLRGLAEKYKL